MYQPYKFTFGNRDLEVRTLFDGQTQQWVFGIFDHRGKVHDVLKGLSKNDAHDASVLGKPDLVTETQKFIANGVMSGQIVI
jgi:hypothetical protein